MKRCSDGTEVRSVDAHLVERLGVYDVEAAASVHQYFCESLRANDRCGVTAALDLALIGALEGGTDGDDPTGARHFSLRYV